MRQLMLIVVLLAITTQSWGQIKLGGNKPAGRLTNGRMMNDTLNDPFSDEQEIVYDAQTHYTDYKIISYAKDTTIVDTTLSIKKERHFNAIRKSTFELMPMHNLGQTYNKLGYDFTSINILPNIGVRAKQYGYYSKEQVNYYRVPTPTTELFFQTGIQQGQVLNSMLTMNINPQLNLSVAFKGLRSLGDYRNALASHQNLRLTASYQTKNNRYIMRSHYTGQNLYHQENGGLTEASLLLYAGNDERYRDRERLETRFIDADSRLKSRTYFLEHGYNLWYHGIDSLHQQVSYLQLGHEFAHDRQYYTYNQDNANPFYGDSYTETVADSTFYFKTSNAAFAELKAPWLLGQLRVKAQHTQYSYGYDNIIHLENMIIPARLKGYNISTHARWQARFRTFGLNAKAGTIIEGMFNGNYLTGTASFKPKDSLFDMRATLLVKSESPQFNSLLYQSAYTDYNWYNALKNQRTRVLKFDFLSDKLLDASVVFTNLDNYTYFNAQSHPAQADENLSYLKVKAHKTLQWRKWSMENTMMYQKVANGSGVLHLPDFVTQNSLYYTSYVFTGNPLYLQTGLTVKYFTKYYADEFNPLINEFYVQNNTKIGGYPLLDFFVNGQVKKTRLFFKLENLNSLWDGGKYLTTPTQPYRDFTVRFGLVWNFFI